MKTWGDVFELADQELVSELADVTSHENALAATRLTLLAEIDRRGLAMKLGHSSVTRWYAKSVRITDGSATRQMELGHWLTDWPNVLDALAGGDIHASHASAIADGVATVLVADPTLDVQRRSAVVAELLETAMRSTAGQVTSRAHALAHSAADDARARHEQAEKQRREREQASRADAGSSDTDNVSGSGDTGGSRDAGGSGDAAGSGGPEPAGPEPVPAGPPPVPVSENPNLNRFDIHPLADGRFQFGGNVDQLLAEKLLTALSPLTAPRPGPGGERDPRSPSKRRADALDQILDRHLRGSSRGAAGGSRASVHLIVPLRDLLAHGGNTQSDSTATDSTGTSAAAESSSNGGVDRDSDGSGGEAAAGGSGAGQGSAPGPGDADWPFRFDWAGPISRSLAELLTCDADLTPVIVDDHGVPLALGRTTRLASDDQRIALTIRDTCCVMCGRPAQWCQAHHVKFWEDGGATDLNNLALVCGECHRLVHHGDWKLIMGEDGHPYAIPPESVDPRRQPIPTYHRRKRRAA
ncbi:HNH endonuclease signature motif containing protein [Rhodococcoides fascians]|uniref:HNH endonuclease signature motif containing protein n=1 Tax=Rhodococcoides fascians TaxID=1828 RepID=UPI00050C176D|nr:HNH endonuclease signature motif containing protein [Rhodococcus fascians]